MPRKGQKHSDKAKKLMSEQKKGSKNPAYGKPPWNKGLTKETDERVAKNAANTSKGSRHLKPTDEARKAASERWKGDKNPAKDPEVIKKRVETRHKRYEHWQPDGFTSWNKGLTKEDDDRIANIGKTNSIKMKGQRCGPKSNFWRGGVTPVDYCPKFNTPFKEYIRNKFNRKCFICGKTEEENKEKLSIHHIDYDKLDICNGKSWPFISVCRSHNSKFNGNCWYWFNLLINYWTINPDIHFINNEFISLDIYQIKYKYSGSVKLC